MSSKLVAEKSIKITFSRVNLNTFNKSDRQTAWIFRSAMLILVNSDV